MTRLIAWLASLLIVFVDSPLHLAPSSSCVLSSSSLLRIQVVSFSALEMVFCQALVSYGTLTKKSAYHHITQPTAKLRQKTRSLHWFTDSATALPTRLSLLLLTKGTRHEREPYCYCSSILTKRASAAAAPSPLSHAYTTSKTTLSTPNLAVTRRRRKESFAQRPHGHMNSGTRAYAST